MRSTGHNVLSVRKLRKSYGGQIVLNDISFNLRQGEVVLLRGENGSGKTTLLNILTGNLEPDVGEIKFDLNGNKETFNFPKIWWRDLNPNDHFTPERLAREGVGRLWQDIRLFPTMTILENVAVATTGQKGENPIRALLPGSKSDDINNYEISVECLTRVGLTENLDSSCDKISLGQMKRVAIARAILAGAKILFLDEPLSGLDKNEKLDVMRYLNNLVTERSITIVIVEHVFNIPTILTLADTVWTILKGNLETIEAKSLETQQISKEHGFYDLVSTIACTNGSVCTQELPHGARLTIANSSKYNNSPIAFEINELVVKRGIRTVIDGLSIILRKGQIAILEAPNGWGRSTLLDAIAGLQSIESGKVVLNGIDVSITPTYKRVQIGLSYLRSQMTVFNSLNVREHVKIANADDHLFKDSLNGNSKGSFLSGGEKQKLLIDILPEGDVYLLDEPMMGLDKDAIDKLYLKVTDMIDNGKVILITVPQSNYYKHNSSQ